MYGPRIRNVVFAITAIAFTACGAGGANVDTGNNGSIQDALTAEGVELVAELDRMPSGVAIWDGRIFLSLPRWGGGDSSVVELTEAGVVPYPSAEANDIDALGVEAIQSVNGMHVDSQGRLWILDNARIDLAPGEVGAPKVIVWDIDANEEAFRFHFSEDIAPAGSSFLNDIVVDEARGFAYITETGMGGTPALIAYDYTRDLAWRCIEGTGPVSADSDMEMVIDEQTVMLHRPDEPIPWRVAANAIALSPDGQTLYFGPMTGRTLYSIPTLALRNPDLTDEERLALVETHSDKPVTDGIATDADGRLFFTDVEAERIVRLDGTELVELAADPLFSFPVAIEVAGDWVYFTSNQLHRMPAFHGGEDQRTPPYFLWRIWDPEADRP